MLKGETVAEIILAALGVFIIRQALQLDYTNEYGPGPGFIPLWIGLGLLLLALLLIYLTVRGAHTWLAQKTWRETIRAVGTWAVLMIAVTLLKHVGFVASFALLGILLVYGIDRRSLIAATAVGVGGAAGFYLAFGMALGLSLPKGPWGF